MSYILEALRRAEAQRQQQSAEPPGLGSANGVGMPTEPAPAAPSPAPTAADPAPRRAGWLAGSVAVLGLAAVVVLQAMRPATGPATASPAPTAPSATPATAALPPPTAVPAPPPPTEAAPAPILQPAPAPAPAPAPVPVPEAARPAQPSTTARPTSAAVPRYADLPESVRSTLPAISVQGVTWSENPALRHLIVNGRVLQEGQSIGPEHVLEQIGRDGSVLNHRGQRYRIGH